MLKFIKNVVTVNDLGVDADNLKQNTCPAEVWEYIIEHPPIPPVQSPWEISDDGNTVTLKEGETVKMGWYDYSGGYVYRYLDVTECTLTGFKFDDEEHMCIEGTLNGSPVMLGDEWMVERRRNTTFSFFNYDSGPSIIEDDDTHTVEATIGWFVAGNNGEIIGWTQNRDQSKVFVPSTPQGIFLNYDNVMDTITIQNGVYDISPSSLPKTITSPITLYNSGYGYMDDNYENSVNVPSEPQSVYLNRVIQDYISDCRVKSSRSSAKVSISGGTSGGQRTVGTSWVDVGAKAQPYSKYPHDSGSPKTFWYSGESFYAHLDFNIPDNAFSEDMTYQWTPGNAGSPLTSAKLKLTMTATYKDDTTETWFNQATDDRPVKTLTASQLNNLKSLDVTWTASGSIQHYGSSNEMAVFYYLWGSYKNGYSLHVTGSSYGMGDGLSLDVNDYIYGPILPLYCNFTADGLVEDFTVSPTHPVIVEN